ncbi:cyclohexanecarboxylate-CoA ligase [Pseudonocardia halophobica]|uniref:Cyclohexanecarboxylate-CoA ligase n=1 Tax=Pseudonocardia halophobica TaxID=29401 RepID=A0A9W6P1U1_9PSEU|nr:AMP-binding protein [Pseudonocardia halophobica]GLL16246.1 cyclohexanecarboxylate-CoA ligase [Pseudonocardia halophobica]
MTVTAPGRYRPRPDLVAAYTAPGLWEETRVDSYLRERAAQHPDRLALVDRGNLWSYGALDREVDRWATALRNHGVGLGTVVSWQLPNWAEAVVLHQATLRLGAVSNPIIPIYRHSEVSFILRQAQSEIVFVPAAFRGFDFPSMLRDIRDELPDLATVVVVGDAPSEDGVIGLDAFLARAAPAQARAGGKAADDANAIALLLYTSGTTSSPKGALHTHNTLDYENRSMIEFFGLTSSDVVLMPSPVTHITGVLYGLQLPFMLGGAVVLLDVWEPGAGLELMERHGCTFMVAATPFLHGLVHHPARTPEATRTLRVFACGGADVPPELVHRATDELGCLVSRVYGSTEFPTATSSNLSDPTDKRARTDGRAIGQAPVVVVDDEDRPVPPGEPGHLLVRGPELFVGYLDDALNADAFTPDGWFRTGELPVVDGEVYVEITGRQKDIIIRGGENISAKEVEDRLFEHPKVADVAVVAVPDPVLVERACAVVVPEAGVEVDLDELTTWLREHHRLAMQKLPEYLVLVDELPRTASGKVQKFKLRDRLRRCPPTAEPTR